MSNNRLTNTENDSQQPSHNSQPLFFLGSIVATPGALELPSIATGGDVRGPACDQGPGVAVAGTPRGDQQHVH